MYERMNINIEEVKRSNIVDVILQIMTEEDGPAPARNLKKRPNAVDQFKDEHIVELGSPDHSGNLIDKVNHHNQTVPRLYDELDRRKSIVKVATLNANTMSKMFDPKCCACAQLATFNELKKLDLKPRCMKDVAESRSRSSTKPSVKTMYRRRRKSRRSRNRRYRRRNSNDKRIQDRLVGIEKTKFTGQRNSSKTLNRRSRTWSNKSCQYSDCLDKEQESKISHSVSTNTVSNKQTLVQPQSDFIIEKDGNNKTGDKSHTNNGSRDPSVSSYNSFMSMDHEPMDSKP